MFVTITAFVKDVDKYAQLALLEEVRVTKQGKEIFSVSPPTTISCAELIQAMRGSIPLTEETRNLTVEDIRAERRRRYEYPD